MADPMIIQTPYGERTIATRDGDRVIDTLGHEWAADGAAWRAVVASAPLHPRPTQWQEGLRAGADAAQHRRDVREQDAHDADGDEVRS